MAPLIARQKPVDTAGRGTYRLLTGSVGSW